MKNQLSTKRGLKRPNCANKVENLKKKLVTKFNYQALGSVSSDDEEEEIPNNQLAFDSLLEQLESEKYKLANLYKKSQHEEEERSDSEEVEDGGLESDGMPDEENAGMGSKSNNDDQREDDAEDEDEAYSEDDANDSESDDPTNAEEIASSSSFHSHVEHIITNEDADKLTQSKWKYKWEVPAVDTRMSKWVGTGKPLLMEDTNDLVYGIKPKLYKHWLDIHKASGFANMNSHLRFFFSLCNSYRDIMHCNKKPFYFKGEEDSATMDAYLMHALNHVFKTRNIVSKNNAKLERENNGKDGAILSDSCFLDHGFTRPKVMFLLPLGSIALRVVKRLIQLVPASYKFNVDHMDRFAKEFGKDDDEEEDESLKTRKTPKPKDFQRLFGGNNNDHFMVGIKLTKRSIKLYNDFYTSDIIVASPLGLITKIAELEAQKENHISSQKKRKDVTSQSKKKDVDYLSSIELLIIDHADVIAMQNWAHLNTIVEQLNRLPSGQSRNDIFRIRKWYLNGHARFYRQTILLGSYINPDMNALFNRSCLNYEGKVKMVSEYKSVLPKVLVQVKQVYERFNASSIVDVDDARFDYFCEKVFPKIKDSTEGGTMLFISSYFEFVRIRNFLTSQEASFCMFGDYTEASDISRARGSFFKGERKIVLYTERAHFYYRYKIRGMKKLIIYSLPERKDFYPEIINTLEGSNNMLLNVLFSSFDRLRLERIVGTPSAKRLVSSDRDIFVFC